MEALPFVEVKFSTVFPRGVKLLDLTAGYILLCFLIIRRFFSTLTLFPANKFRKSRSDGLLSGKKSQWHISLLSQGMCIRNSWRRMRHDDVNISFLFIRQFPSRCHPSTWGRKEGNVSPVELAVITTETPTTTTGNWLLTARSQCCLLQFPERQTTT